MTTPVRRCNGTTRSHAGFTDGIPWLPVNPNYVTINAATQLEDPDSVFHHFRKLIKLRHDHPVVVHGRFELLLPDHEQIWALTRTLDDQVLVMVANCSSEPATRARRMLFPTCRALSCCWRPTVTRRRSSWSRGNHVSISLAEPVFGVCGRVAPSHSVGGRC